MNLKVAIVHDDFIQRGGAERLVIAMLEVFPQADLYATMATPEWEKEIRKQSNKEIKKTWLQKLPFKEKFFRYYYSLYPLAVESWKFDNYDLVISSSARYAHGVITKPSTVHIAYVNSPARFLWEDKLQPKNPLLRPIISWHRAWDRVAGQRPDWVIANSTTPAERIRKYWNREADSIIYPFVDLEKFDKGTNLIKGTVLNLRTVPFRNYFLVVSRLKSWKRIDLAIRACNDLKLPLIVIGQGEDEARLRKMSGPSIKFLHDVQDDRLVELYRGCLALIQTQEEDFGLTALEAQASGKPVIAYGKGGSLETVSSGVTGEYFQMPTVESLLGVLGRFDGKKYLRENCLRGAQRFGRARFQKDLVEFVDHVLRKE